MNTDQKILESPQDAQTEDQGKRNYSKVYLTFAEELAQHSQSEEKLRVVISFLREALSQSGNPRFKDFWDGRRLALGLFKENLNPLLRMQFWNEYIELSAEARRLKEILDEQSSFAIEQIELAILGVEKEIENYDTLLFGLPNIALPDIREAFASHEFYLDTQKELDFLNNLASRINSYRKETLKTEMRIRQKNKFFSRLSTAGDRIFPKRKELIKKISDEFFADVQKFITNYFSDFSEGNVPIYDLREEIKALQDAAKILTLNTHCFTETRLLLSEAWDKLKNFEKERKKEQVQKKAASRQNFDLVLEKIQVLEQYCQDEASDVAEMNKQAEEISHFMRGIELSRDDVRALKDALQKAKSPLLQRLYDVEKEKERVIFEKQQAEKDKILNLKKDIEALILDQQDLPLDSFIAKKDGYYADFEKLSLNKIEKQSFDRLFKQFRDLIADKKQKVLLGKSEDDLQNLENLRGAYQERKERRQEIKNQIESYRKALGGSGLDFEKAMLLRELTDAEKIQLDKINQAISEIEDKIAQLEG